MRPAVLVDPYAGAKDYSPAFRARGVRTLALLSTPKPLPAFLRGWFPDEFDEVWTFNGDLPALVERLRAEDPLCVEPGNESAIELAEALNETLLPHLANTPGGTAARRDKWHMAQALRNAGVPVVRQLCSADPDEVVDWLRETRLHGSRLVLKPPKSGGTDDVHVFDPGQDWRPVFERLVTTTNRFGFVNGSVLVQEFVAGTEYVVDTYSVAGRHGVADVLEYTKGTLGQRLGVYLRSRLLPPEHPQIPALLDYTYRVLDAVGIRNGGGHTEIIFTADGPRLMEVAARLAGTPLQALARYASKDCQIDRAVRHVLDGEFTPGYRLLRHASVALLCAPRAGVLRNGELLDEMRALPTVQAAALPYRTGDNVPATADLFTNLGYLILGDPDEAAVETDYNRIRTLEQQLVID